MSKCFKFINAQSTPQDLYCVEIVTLEFAVLTGRDSNGQPQFTGQRLPYLRKRTKDGGLFWGSVSSGVQYHDKKNYLSVRFSDSFFNEDIETYLNERSWETKVNVNTAPSAFSTPIQGSAPAQPKQDDMPF